MEWYSTATSFATIASGAQTNLLLYNSTFMTSAPTRGVTITRMILDMRFRADSINQLPELFWGVTIINADARAAGAFPDADDMADKTDWMVRGRLMTIQSDLGDSSQWDRSQYDLRSQRIFRSSTDELHLILDASGSGVTGQWACFARVLVKFP